MTSSSVTSVLEENSVPMDVLPSIGEFKANPTIVYWTYMRVGDGLFPVRVNWTIYHQRVQNIGPYSGLRRTTIWAFLRFFAESCPPCPRCEGQIREETLPDKERDQYCVRCGFRVHNWMEVNDPVEEEFPAISV